MAERLLHTGQMRKQAHAHTRTRAHAHTCILTHTRADAHTHALTHTRTRTHAHTHTRADAHTSSNTGRDTAIITATATWHRTVRWDPTSSFSLRSRRLGPLSCTPILRLPTHRDGVTKPLALKVHDACVDETRRNTAAKKRSAVGTRALTTDFVPGQRSGDSKPARSRSSPSQQALGSGCDFPQRPVRRRMPLLLPPARSGIKPGWSCEQLLHTWHPSLRGGPPRIRP